MKYGKHDFSPDLHNELRCELCGEHLTNTQHLVVKASRQVRYSSTEGIGAFKFFSGLFKRRMSN